MKIDKKETIYSTNLTENQSDNFSFHDEGLIMSLIQDKMYQKKLYTPLQEVLSNARDAVREKHWVSIDPELSKKMSEDAIRLKISELYESDLHINITMPNELNPVLIIRDYGVGISPERLTLIKRVGLSTKNTSNVQTGGFGLGLKSLFAYTEQFYIVSFYNKIKYTYICQKNVNKMGAIVLVDEEQTDELNGVELRVPIKEEDMRIISTHIVDIIRFWDTKPLINKKTINNMNELRKSDELVRFDNGSLMPNWSYHLAVIDGIPYNLDIYRYCSSETVISEKLRNYKLVLFFNVGEIDLVMTREGLEDSVKNKELIKNRINSFLIEIKDYSKNKLFNARNSLLQYSNEFDYLNNLFILNKLLDHTDLNFEIAKDGFNIVVSENKVAFQVNEKPVHFNVLTSEIINTRKHSSENEKAVLRLTGDFLLVGDSDSSLKKMSISVDEMDKKINNYSEKKKKEIYFLNKKEIDSGYVYIMYWDIEIQDSNQSKILQFLMDEFSLKTVQIKYPGNLNVLDELNVFGFSKKTRSIIHREKSCKLNGKTKYTRYKTTSNELYEICSKIDGMYSIDKERFFTLLKEFNIELIFSKEEFFPNFTVGIFSDLFNSNMDKILDPEEMTKYFVKLRLKSVQKTYNLWYALSKKNTKQIVLNNNLVTEFIANEFKNIKEAESDWRYTGPQLASVKSKTSYYENLFSKNKVLSDKMKELFPFSIKLEQCLQKHPLVKDSTSSQYSISSSDCILLNNYVSYINSFFKDDDCVESTEN